MSIAGGQVWSSDGDRYGAVMPIAGGQVWSSDVYCRGTGMEQ